ncbi:MULTISPECIES: chloride channel protein [Dyella]|uniref:Chloride channel protein n=2 Tax=Dyella TaxID=231454 RepID=A0A4R0YVN5_9GAMM|nr:MULTISPECIES: chloride channel protein [Dyella]TBR38904.1 chloride channel protein [Dyella terrae]TCI13505.1 chloride channel protein [Dyella soli]
MSDYRRFQRLAELDIFSPVQWRRRVLFWTGAVVVGLAAVGFAQAADFAFGLFHRMVEHSRWWAFIVTPATFALLAWVTQGALKPTRGSGIPQAIAALHVEDEGFRRSLLSLRVAMGKMALTLVALLGGASVGREGPTVHVGAGLLYSLGRRFGFADPAAAGRFILAGSAAGLAAAFNTPLAGVVFAIEEMSGAFEHRMSGILLTAVIIAGVVSLGILGNYAYFGRLDMTLPLGQAWWAVLATGVVCGLAGGLFARLIVPHNHGLRGVMGRLRARSPVVFAACCGLALVLLSQLTNTGLYGTGYAQARAILEGHGDTVASFGVLKFFGNIASFWAGIPGGIFSPALAVGAGLGQNITALVPGADGSAVILLAMAGYLAGVTQAPLTATVISMELTANQQMALPIMATCLIARLCSSLFSHKPVYKALADKLIEQFEAEKARREAEPDPDDVSEAAAPTRNDSPDTP